MTLEHLAHENIANIARAALAFEPDHGARLELLTGMHEGLPDHGFASFARLTQQ